MTSFKIAHGNRIIDFFCRDASEIDGLKPVLNGESYPVIPFLRNVCCIIDIGAHVGSAAVYFNSLYPEADIFSFEPDDESFSLLVMNSKQIEQGKLRPFNFGLFNHDVELPFYQYSGCALGNSICQIEGFPEDSCTITKIKLRKLLSVFMDLSINTNIDILKIDTEGCEINILSEVLCGNYNIKILYIEYHAEYFRDIINKMLFPTHVLWHVNILNYHRGELVYVNRQFVSNLATGGC
ncbi:MAG: FkbM family methyltransferase [Magnetococcales bacterium]|nr:FkbM family methyltransferase [Magnetococcales bacterium]